MRVINEIFLSIQQISLNAKQQTVAIQVMNFLNQVAIQIITQVKIVTKKCKEASQNLQTIS